MERKRRLTVWLRARDPDLAATRRAARTAVVMPLLFAVCTQVLQAPVTATFAAFGTFAMLLLVDFTGPMSQRLRAYGALAVAWLVLVTLGTLASRSVWTATAATVVVSFAVLFAGVVSSVLAGASTSLLLAFVLPVSAPGPPAVLPDRLTGVVLAAAAAVVAVRLLWPRPEADPLSAPAAQACRAAAKQLRTDADYFAGRTAGPAFGECRDCAQETESSARELQRAFTATPYRPTGLSTGSRALVRLVDELTWLSTILAESAPAVEDGSTGTLQSAAVRKAAARVLILSADLLDAPGVSPDRLHAAVKELRTALAVLEDGAVGRLPAPYGAVAAPAGPNAFVDSLDVSFRAQEMAFVVLQIAGNVDIARAAAQRSWPDRLLGRAPESPTGPLTSATERAAAHAEPHSVWLHNSVRGAISLGIAVALADVTGLQHAFWVVLGTLSVLRSNALNTGQNAFRALGGTLAGSILGAVLLQIIGRDTTALWILLPISVLAAGIVPAAISFAAGQAAFTLTLVILFNIAQPAGLSVILFRIEDIALGCAVSLAVGLLFWPRGASSAVVRAMAEAYADSARYLRSAVDYAVSCCTSRPENVEVPPEGRRAAASARRLDDAFRTYLAERGAKTASLGEMTNLITGVVGLRLAADAILALWGRSGGDGPVENRAAARTELLAMSQRVCLWYRSLAARLGDGGPAPDPLPSDEESNRRLVDAVRRDLHDADGQATATGIRIIWTGDHLEAVRRLQTPVAAAAENTASRARVSRVSG
ncbi:FUSC family protein [Streptomyces actinomycinicus]|uniref:FUSC family protein n=1 Tax=Streptomyces actinomycinicus TaxID=1695166 RepID=A0A937EJR6_9ACTN|nr:FUSC family protein [Streptomyces actinomycinicus]MBL1083753.1 FUSC family protein [Streptomyces actinomycinicus]